MLDIVLAWWPAALFLCLLAIAALNDVARRKIPNWTVVALMAAYALMHVVGLLAADPAYDPAPTVWWSGLAAGVIGFAVTYALYMFNILGAGDSKLFAAVALFAGLGHLLHLVLFTALAGGLLAIGYLVIMPKKVMRRMTTRGRAENPGGGIPYGVAIALGAVLTAMVQGFIRLPA